jgi:hypothetical protein
MKTMRASLARVTSQISVEQKNVSNESCKKNETYFVTNTRCCMF